MEKRSLYEWVFGKKTDETNSKGKPFELINTTSSKFYAWSGNIFDSDIVRSAIRPIANSVGKLEAKHIHGKDENVINQVPYILELLQHPNPYMSMQDFLTKMIFQREITHNAFAYVQRDDYGKVTGIYPIPYSGIELIEFSGELFARFNFLTGKRMTVYYTDLIHLRKDFSSHDFYGDSPNICLKNIMEIMNTTDQGMVSAVKNSAIIKWILKFKNTLRPDDVKMQVDEFTRTYLAISNTGGAAYSDPRYDLEQVKESSYVPNAAQMKEAVQRLYKYFGVNDSIVQSNADEDQWLSFYESIVEPIAMQLSSAFTRAFFNQQQRSRGNRIVFDSSNLTFASMATKLNLVQMVDRGAMTPDEWRKVLNLPPIEGGDKPIRRLDTALVNDTGGAADAEDDTKSTDTGNQNDGTADSSGTTK